MQTGNRLSYIFRVTAIVAIAAATIIGCESGMAPKTEKASDTSTQDSVVIQDTILDSVVPVVQANSKPDDTSSQLSAELCDYDNLWLSAQASFRLDSGSVEPQIEVYYRWYAKHEDYLARVSQRADRYLFHILTELDKRDMPAEIMLLPIVESAFDPFAYSHGRASGMWQFIPSTGKMYGLKQNWWYDGRRDIVASTAAALDYLQMLSNYYDGDWLLALAAYNSGMGTVNRAIRHNKKLGKEVDFWNLKLPDETSAYVPKLLALAKLIGEHELVWQHFTPIPNIPYFEVVDVGSQIDLAFASELSQTEIEEIYRLNPGYNRWATDPEGPHRLLVPADQSALFQRNLEELPKEQRVTWKRYRVKSNDNLGVLAQQYHTSVSAIQEANGISGNIIRVGDSLLIPVASTSLKNYSLSADLRRQRIQSRSAGRTNRIKQYYEVTPGDSFWKISREYKVGVAELARWNSMAPKDPLMPGTRLVVWSKKPGSDNAGRGGTLTRKVYYPVRDGDSLAKIASRFRVKTSDVIRWNSLQKKKYIHAGDRLVLYVDVSRTSI
ncbi:MAG: LysM peptidoglycan-binding domain-containing protein [Pseudomonadales bacterium]|nr:LysM peptidoglycan-binding domain-containing protein [Pseudomonadales bacterium]